MNIDVPEPTSYQSNSTRLLSIRQLQRQRTKLVQRHNRDAKVLRKRGCQFDSFSYGFDDEVSKSEMQKLAVELRKHGKIDARKLMRIQHGILQDEEYVSILLSTEGSLNGLVKHLTGHNPTLQLKAAYCLCNLAKSGNKTSYKVTKCAGTYLITYLHSTDFLLQDACIWALGNLVANCSYSWNIAYKENIQARLLELLKSSYSDVSSAAVYTLTHFLTAGYDTLKDVDLLTIAQQAAPLLNQLPGLCRLIFLLSSHPCCDHVLLSCSVPEVALSRLTLLVGEDSQDQAEITHLVRLLANLSTQNEECAQKLVLSFLGTSNFVIWKLISSCHLSIHNDILWLLSNLANHSSIQDSHDFVCRLWSNQKLNEISFKMEVVQYKN